MDPTIVGPEAYITVGVGALFEENTKLCTKNGDPAVCDNMGEPGGHYVK